MQGVLEWAAGAWAFRHCGLDPQSHVYGRRLRIKSAMTGRLGRNAMYHCLVSKYLDKI